jgi:hypothetical protein
VQKNALTFAARMSVCNNFNPQWQEQLLKSVPSYILVSLNPLAAPAAAEAVGRYTQNLLHGRDVTGGTFL